MLFESFFKQLIKLSRHVFNAIQGTDMLSIRGGLVDDIVVGRHTFTIQYDKRPIDYGGVTLDAAAYILPLTYTKKDVPKKPQHNERDMSIPHGVYDIHINVANFLMSYKEYNAVSDILKWCKKYVVKLRRDVFIIHPRTPKNVFERICVDVKKTDVFYKVLTHEIQHVYGPNQYKWEHREKLGTVSDRVIYPKHFTPEFLQQRANYVQNEDEVNSRIAEAVAYISRTPIGVLALKHGRVDLFVRACIEAIDEAWYEFTPAIQQRVAKKVSVIFDKLRRDKQFIDTIHN